MIYLAYEKNPYTFFVICEHETFQEVIQHIDKIASPAAEGSVEDAFLFYECKNTTYDYYYLFLLHIITTIYSIFI